MEADYGGSRDSDKAGGWEELSLMLWVVGLELIKGIEYLICLGFGCCSF